MRAQTITPSRMSCHLLAASMQKCGTASGGGRGRGPGGGGGWFRRGGRACFRCCRNGRYRSPPYVPSCPHLGQAGTCHRRPPPARGFALQMSREAAGGCRDVASSLVGAIHCWIKSVDGMTGSQDRERVTHSRLYANKRLWGLLLWSKSLSRESRATGRRKSHRLCTRA